MTLREDLPRFISPMLLTAGPVPDGDRWSLEVKWAAAALSCATTAVRSRSGRATEGGHRGFPELMAIAQVLGKRQVTLDGELVCLRDDGKPDFSRLRRLTGSYPGHPVVLQLFDLLHLDGESTRSLPYYERRALLEGLVLDAPACRTLASLTAVDAAR